MFISIVIAVCLMGWIPFAPAVLQAQEPEDSGKGYVILEQDKPFAEQITKANTAYVLANDFDLGGKTVEFPSGCVLRAEGGVLSNGTLVSSGTHIEGYGKLFDKTVRLSGWDVDFLAEWLGIVPGVDCSEEFEAFSQYGLKILFKKGAYSFKICNIVLSRGTELCGADAVYGTEFNIQPKDKSYRFLIGINYNCSIRHIRINYKSAAGITPAEVLRIDNAFDTTPSTDMGSQYNYYIDNVYITGIYEHNGSYEKNITGLCIRTNKLNDKGVPNVRTANSFHSYVNDFRVKFATKGIELQVVGENTVWQNSLVFNNILLWARYGVYSNRAQISATGWCLFNNYTFQSVGADAEDRDKSFGIYGYFNYDKFVNYQNWDNKYLGYAWGRILMDPTSLGIQHRAGTFEDNTTDGFLTPENRGLVVNPIRVKDFRFISGNFDASVWNDGKIDFSVPGGMIWMPDTKAPTHRIEESLNIKGSNLSFGRKYYSFTHDTPAFSEEITESAKGVLYKSAGLNKANGSRWVLELAQTPRIDRNSLSLFTNDYKFISAIKRIGLNAVSYGRCVKVSFTASSTEKLDGYQLYVKNISGANCQIVKSEISGLTLDVYALLDGVKEAFVSVEFKVTKFGSGDYGEVDVDDLSISSTFVDAYYVKGKTSARPALNATDAGFQFFDTTLGKPVWWNGSRWVDATGQPV